jgi:phospholipid transport system substrate-binding protein
MNTRIVVSLLAALMIATTPMVAASMDPMAVIKGPIDAVILILNDPQYKVEGTRAAQREAIWKIVKPMFDFDEIARRAVARDWRRFTEVEKTTFADVFAQFLGNTYIDKIQGEYHNEKIRYLEQQLHADRYAEVRTHLVREALLIPVNYRLIKDRQGQWKVYDINVEGVSLVKNYRTQFSSFLRKKKPAQLIQQLNDKLTEQNQRLAENG